MSETNTIVAMARDRQALGQGAGDRAVDDHGRRPVPPAASVG